MKLSYGCEVKIFGVLVEQRVGLRKAWFAPCLNEKVNCYHPSFLEFWCRQSTFIHSYEKCSGSTHIVMGLCDMEEVDSGVGHTE